ncbi:uncharacterized protein MELLADRAFT_103821 [Melampsora larici-populina 98AG31]|uniref:Secreted protein n=1 Tax=Melampsora larici-populina (strain 98AG31 / pathotype 3-4-7) TaxID=747676 RepID=F4RCK4_MELLP|nr:uncharacterized protein MELLADRAFT_103821 [Melampsora larici-populina 98AG31]EGG09750.1 hypothetical protein MELLADRAFT_103821 [Melampsora larici-populina 98AG31]
MISVKSIGIIAIEIFLVSLVSGYRGWGDPACYNLKSVNINPNDCLCALDQFFENSEVYTYTKPFTEESDVKSHGTCSLKGVENAGRVKIPEDPEFIRPTSLACNWLIEITATV